MQGATPDSLLALHDAGYREVVARLGPGLVLDIGCGVGDETARLDGADRVVVGVDYSAQTAREAAVEWGPGGTGGKAVRFAAMDGARLGLRDGLVDHACSSHIIEHFTNPALHVAELARVLAPGGTAYVITPNAPADFENPFHVYLFEPDHLRSLLKLFFSEVQVYGLEGDEVLHADFAARRASGERLLPMVYRVLGQKATGIGSGLDASHLFLTEAIAPTTPVLFAVASKPRPHVGAAPVNGTTGGGQ